LPTLPVSQAALCDQTIFTNPAAPPPSGTVYCPNRLGTGGRNEVYGPGLVNFDFSATKDTKIRENLSLQFRAEVFNIFNRANFNPPLANNTIFNSDGSQNGAGNGTAAPLDSTSTSSRQIQFALKLIF
jgi:hypothetical protein